MKLIDEKYQAVEKYTTDQLFWIYDFKQHDFFLKTCLLWHNIKSDAYIIEIGKGVLSIPFNYFMMIGDYDGGLDFISPDEIVGREFEAFTFSKDFSEASWELTKLKIIGYEENQNFVLPFIKYPFPVSINDTKAILVSNNDLYNKIKETSFGDIL